MALIFAMYGRTEYNVHIIFQKFNFKWFAGFQIYIVLIEISFHVIRVIKQMVEVFI